MKRDPGNPTLPGFVRTVLPVADDGMANRRKLHPDLILQSCQQCHPHQRSSAQSVFDGIFEFSSRRLRVPFRAQFLMHAFSPKIVNQRSFFRGKMSAHDRQILPDGSVREELSNQRIPISHGFREQQNSGREAIDAMHDQSSLPASFQVRREQG
jgi:hypothetical protein